MSPHTPCGGGPCTSGAFRFSALVAGCSSGRGTSKRLSKRIRDALALLRAERGSLEASIDGDRFDEVLSRRLDTRIVAIEALEALPAREEPAA